MALLNAQEREALQNELKKLRFGQAQWKLLRLDPVRRLVFFRNNQEAEKWLTRYDLPNSGVRVTLVESYDRSKAKGKNLRADFKLIDAIVEPLANNNA
jgi:hypothetical protein